MFKKLGLEIPLAVEQSVELLEWIGGISQALVLIVGSWLALRMPPLTESCVIDEDILCSQGDLSELMFWKITTNPKEAFRFCIFRLGSSREMGRWNGAPDEGLSSELEASISGDIPGWSASLSLPSCASSIRSSHWVLEKGLSCVTSGFLVLLQLSLSPADDVGFVESEISPTHRKCYVLNKKSINALPT